MVEDNVEWRVTFPSGSYLSARPFGVRDRDLCGHGAWCLHRLFQHRPPVVRSIAAIVTEYPFNGWVPLFLLWLGIGESSKISLIALGAFFPVYLNLMNGVRSVDRKLVEAGLANGFRGFALAKVVILPASLPAYLVGLRQGLSLGWMFVVAAEIMGASRGLGYLLIDGQATGRPAIMMLSVILFAICGKVSDGLLAMLSERWLYWQDVYKA